MDQIKDFLKNFSFDRLFELLGNTYVIIFALMFLLLIGLIIFCCLTIREKKLKQIVVYEDNNVRYFSIHYGRDFVYSVDKRNLNKKRKENLEWFYNCFAPGEKVRLEVWLNELMKKDHTAPNHLEVSTKVKGNKSLIFTVIDVTHINYEKQIIHLESRLFPSIQKTKRKNKNSKRNVVYYTEMPKILLDYEDNPRTLFLIRLSYLDTLEKESNDFDFTIFTLLISRLVKKLPPFRYLCQLKSNELVLIDFKMRTKNEAIALGSSLVKIINKSLSLSGIDNNVSFKIGINQEKKQYSDFATLTRFAREAAIYAETNDLDTDILIYDQNAFKQQENLARIISNIKRNIDRRLFSCTYVPIINAKDGSIFGYDCLLSAPQSVVYSITSMLEYASNNNFLIDLLRVLYLETNSGYSFSHRNYHNQFLTMPIKLSFYQEIIEIFTRIERPKNVNTIFILNDKEIDEIDVKETIQILKELKHHNITIALEITANSLILLPDILKLFDYFIINGKSFRNVKESQNLILFSDMIARLGSYKGTIIATELESWTIIELFINLNINYISSPLFGQNNKKLPSIDYKKIVKLLNINNSKR